MKENLQRAYILHRRPYRETSLIAELFTENEGRISVIAKGVRKSRSSFSGILEPFTPLLITFSGKSELKFLSHAEIATILPPLQGEALFAGFYLNELLMYLLQKWDAYPTLFQKYENTLIQLRQSSLQQPILRSFEKNLLEALGYGLLPQSKIALHQLIAENNFYHFSVGQGFTRSVENEPSLALFSGKSLLAFAAEDWQDNEYLQDAKRLIRLVLAHLLGERTIHSRELFL